jgi:hypothetical protein
MVGGHSRKVGVRLAESIRSDQVGVGTWHLNTLGGTGSLQWH